MPENSTHKCTNAVNNAQPIRNSSHMAKILSVYNRLQDGDYENGNGGQEKGKSTYSVYSRNASIIRFYYTFTSVVSDEKCLLVVNDYERRYFFVFLHRLIFMTCLKCPPSAHMHVLSHECHVE